MSDGKGKGRAKAPDEMEESATITPGASTTSNSNSILDRVAASASGLARSAFGAPSSSELDDHAAATLASSGKGQSSRRDGSSAWAESSRVSQQTTSMGGSQQPGTSSFRSPQHDQHVASAEAEFSSFLDGIDSFTPSVEADSQAALNSGYAESSSWINRPSTAPSHTSEAPGFRTVMEQEAHDGDEVLGILSDMNPTAVDYYSPQNIEDEIEECRLTEEQVALLQTLTKELFPPAEAHAPVAVSNPLNLHPEVFRSEDTSIWLPDEYAQDSYSYFGQVASPEEASQLWLAQWEGVLTRYADEVWGGLLPLVKEAREEIEAIKEAPEDRRPKALRRLGLVLAHFKT